MTSGKATTIQLYRSSSHMHHWIVWSIRAGWLIFPAKVRGWEDRRPCAEVPPGQLHEVPLWMAFNTGLLEAIIIKAA